MYKQWSLKLQGEAERQIKPDKYKDDSNAGSTSNLKKREEKIEI